MELFRTIYIRADDEHLYLFTTQNREFPRLILKCTEIDASADLAIKCLIIINKILGLGDKYKSEVFLDMIYEKDTAYILEKLQLHPDTNVYNFAARIIDKYFLEEA